MIKLEVRGAHSHCEAEGRNSELLSEFCTASCHFLTEFVKNAPAKQKGRVAYAAIFTLSKCIDEMLKKENITLQTDLHDTLERGWEMHERRTAAKRGGGMI